MLQLFCPSRPTSVITDTTFIRPWPPRPPFRSPSFLSRRYSQTFRSTTSAVRTVTRRTYLRHSIRQHPSHTPRTALRLSPSTYLFPHQASDLTTSVRCCRPIRFEPFDSFGSPVHNPKTPSFRTVPRPRVVFYQRSWNAAARAHPSHRVSRLNKASFWAEERWVCRVALQSLNRERDASMRLDEII